MANRPTVKSRRRWDPGSILAVPAAIGIVLAAQALEGGSVQALLQGAAALIVVGGTMAATLISYSPRELRRAVRSAAETFRTDDEDLPKLTASLVSLAIRAHRKGMLSLEADLDMIRDPFLRNGLTLAIDGVSADTLRQVLTAELRAREDDEETPARIFEAAAGYAPTFGILGAVLGLIQVMRNLAAPSALCAGIAVAFVATVYGLGLANLLLLPLAGRLRERAAVAGRRRELIVEAVVALQQRMNPRLLAQAMRAFAPNMARVDEIVARLPQTRTQPSRFTS